MVNHLKNTQNINCHYFMFLFSGIKPKASELLHYCARHHIVKTSTFPRKEEKNALRRRIRWKITNDEAHLMPSFCITGNCQHSINDFAFFHLKMEIWKLVSPPPPFSFLRIKKKRSKVLNKQKFIINADNCFVQQKL